MISVPIVSMTVSCPIKQGHGGLDVEAGVQDSVDLFVVDVTGDLSVGSSVSVTYEATQNGMNLETDGNIQHNSWLVVYE